MEKKEMSFTDLQCWQKSRQLLKFVYSISKDWRDYFIKDQLHRASLSIMNNIAEGYSRISVKDRQKFFWIAISDLNLCQKEDSDTIRKEVTEIKKMLYSLSSYFEKTSTCAVFLKLL